MKLIEIGLWMIAGGVFVSIIALVLMAIGSILAERKRIRRRIEWTQAEIDGRKRP